MKAMHLAVLSVIVAACFHPRLRESELSGVQFGGTSRISGAANDSITFYLYAYNRSGRAVPIAFTQTCAPGNRIVAYHEPRGGNVAWDDSVWSSRGGPAVLSPLRLEMNCVGLGMLVGSLGPGQSTTSDIRSVPIRVILGDSLPAGTYRFYMNSTMVGAARDKLYPVGEQNLTAPPILRTSAALNPMAKMKGLVRGQVIDSLSEEVVRYAFFDFARVGPDGQLRAIAENGSPHFFSDSVHASIPRDGADGFIVTAKGYFPVAVRIPLRTQGAYHAGVVLQRNPADEPKPQAF